LASAEADRSDLVEFVLAASSTIRPNRAAMQQPPTEYRAMCELRDHAQVIAGMTVAAHNRASAARDILQGPLAIRSRRWTT